MSKSGDIYEQILAALIDREGGRIEVPFTELQERRTVVVTPDPASGASILTLRRPQDEDDIESRRERGGQL